MCRRPCRTRRRSSPPSRNRDYVLYHPYDSFVPVVNLLKEAAVDPEVLAIKITLYRVDRHSPIIEALMDARDNGKAVAATVELKARFDEENNIEWARALETKGVHVVYGLADLKVHAKLCLIIRKEKSGIVRYSHISSGNYNTNTARVYADIGYLTADHGHRIGRLRPVQFIDRLLPEGGLPEIVGLAGVHAQGDHPAHRPGDRAAQGQGQRLHRLETERPGGQGGHPGALPGFDGGRQDRP